MIPIYNAIIQGDDEGIFKISLVDYPAVESNFVAFGKQTEQKFAIKDEMQHMITGVVMRADFPIYRYDSMGEYYIKYSKETIKYMAEKMMKDSTFNNINLQHEDGTDVEGVDLVELFIKNTSNGISPIGFEDIEEGSLFATYKVNNEEVWEDIKEGKGLFGFSLEGLFTLEREPESIENQDNKIFKHMKELITKLAKAFLKYGNIETDKGTVYWVGEADLQIGDELFYDKGDEIIKVEDGEYKLTDGTIIKVTEGLVSEIVEKDGEQEGELDMAEEKPEDKGDEVACEDEDNVEEEDPKDKEIADLKAENDRLKAEIEDLKKKLEEPAAAPITEEFEKVTKESPIPTFGSRPRLNYK